MIYQKRIEQFSSEIKSAEKTYNRISLMRLFASIAAASGLVLNFYFDAAVFGNIVFSAGLFIFIALVILHIRVIERKQYLQRMLLINKDSYARTTGEWIEFPDAGEEYSDLDHPYSRDLDVFGKASLFQLINATNTPHGRMLLAATLKKPYKPHREIIRMQDAVTELAEKIEWRQRFQAEGMRFDNKNSSSLPDFSREDAVFSSKKMIYLIRALPMVLAGTITASVLISSFPAVIPAALVILQMFIIAVTFRKTNAAVRHLLKFREMIKVYNGLIRLIEQEQFSSEYITDLKNRLLNKNNKTASSAIQRLETLTDLISIRASIIHFPVNILTMIDLQCIISFGKWYDESGILFGRWIDAVAHMETAASLSLLKYDNPHWCMPVINDATDGYVIAASAIAHPLIVSDSSVANDFVSDKKGRINIITGSNMSGKSTFLRTVALNLVLAYAGAPVCARKMECSIMKIYTSMRIIDNIGKHVSSFYAELLRIKMIIDESKNKEKIFFALDELFRGTNSRDRILGARAVIKNLSSENVAGMISTHDLELTELAKDDTADIKNYHFRETYEHDGILFDYKIYDGVSTTSDAVYLMKKAGINI
jgi:ABC-type multidrug transport system fused ATPase/permease subunit